MPNLQIDRASNPLIVGGVENPEDIALIPGTDWIVTSAYSDAAIPSSRSYFVHTKTHEIRPAYPDNCSFDLDRARFGDVEPPEAVRFHGLDVKKDGDLTTLYQVNHPLVHGPRSGTGRESVEVFEIDLTIDGPSLRWRGAVIAPSWVSGNDLCALPGGGFAVTNSYFKGREGLDMAFAGLPSGNVLEWINREQGWMIVEGTDLNAPNGIAVSSDGEYYFIASWATKRVIRVSRSDPHGSRAVLNTGAMIDNITWTPDGLLMLAGQVGEAAAVRTAFESGHGLTTPFKGLAVDPVTMEMKTALSEERSDWYATTVLQIKENEFWVGSVHSRQLLVYRL